MGTKISLNLYGQTYLNTSNDANIVVRASLCSNKIPSPNETWRVHTNLSMESSTTAK